MITLDKNEYNLRLEEINRLVDEEAYEEASQIADTIEWKRVRNVRTLCMVSDVYMAVGRLEDCKALLLRAYRRSPLGKNILYRLTEVTTGLKQFDEAIEYYSEYIQAAPHDNNRFILKYKIYKGRGSSVDEQIEILKEYLDQEYNEKYAYELAKLYQQADRIQECLASCDDLVLWFQSGHYVLKALELKSRYAALTPKQQDIYDRERMREEAGQDEPEVSFDTIGQEKQMVGLQDESAADSIMEDAAKQIAMAVKDSVENGEAAGQTEDVPQESAKEAEAEGSAATVVFDREAIRRAAALEAAKEESAKVSAEPEEAESTEEGASAEAEETKEIAEETEIKAEDDKSADSSVEDTEEADEEAEEVRAPEVNYDPESLHEDVIQGVHQIISGVGRRDEVDPDQEAVDQVIEASKKDQEEAMAARQKDLRMHLNSVLNNPQNKKASAGKLSIDDVLLSMGEKGTAVRQAVEKAGLPKKATPQGVLSAVDEALLNMGVAPQAEETEIEDEMLPEKTEAENVEVNEAPEAEMGEEADALEYAMGEEEPEEEVPLAADTSIGDTRPMPDENTLREALEAAAIKNESESAAADEAEETDKEETAEEEAAEAEETPLASDTEEAEEDAETPEEVAEAVSEDGEDAAIEAEAEEAEEVAAETEETEEAEETAPAALPEEEMDIEDLLDAADEEMLEDEDPGEEEETLEDTLPEEEDVEDMSMDDIINARTRRIPRAEIEAELNKGRADNKEGVILKKTEGNAKRRKMRRILPASIRGYFDGFTQVPDLEMQISQAVSTALAKGSDRTSRSGNILIFGGHGSGKTSLATALAKAIAEQQGKEFVKMAKIFATEFNRKDIAATIAKIAGGILIIEEAGDMEDAIADQLTTALEFRTDGLIIIMEDEERYLRSLLMKHPRLTMKFTSQIYLPNYSINDLVNFAEQIASESDCTLSEEAADALAGKLQEMIKSGNPVSLIDLRAMMEIAVKRAGKLSRKLFGGRKRYDEYGRILLSAKDVR